MDTVGSPPPKFGMLPEPEATPDLADLLTAMRVVNREMPNKEPSLSEQASVRFVLNGLLDVALEVVAGGNDELTLFSSYSVFADLPY